jgi:hypothetical protein
MYGPDFSEKTEKRLNILTVAAVLLVLVFVGGIMSILGWTVYQIITRI